MKQITQKAQQNFIKSKGRKCPVCGSSKIRYDTDIENMEVDLLVGCLDCESHWTARYLLIGFDTLIDKRQNSIRMIKGEVE